MMENEKASEYASGEWETKNLVASLRKIYPDAIRNDIVRVHLEGGLWGVGLVVTYWDCTEYRELLGNIYEDGTKTFNVEWGADRNAAIFLTLSPVTLVWCFSTNLIDEAACHEIDARLNRPGAALQG